MSIVNKQNPMEFPIYYVWESATCLKSSKRLKNEREKNTEPSPDPKNYQPLNETVVPA